MNGILDVDIELNQPNGELVFELGEEVRGEIVAVSSENIDLISLSYKIEYSVKGKLNAKTESIFEKMLLTHDCLKSGEEYRYPIRFTNTGYETYRGKNASIHIQFVVEAMPEKEERLPFLKAINPFSERTNWPRLLKMRK